MKRVFKNIFILLKSVSKRLVQLLYYSGREFARDQCFTRSAALTYFTLLSLIPLLVLVFAFFKTFGGESIIETQIKPIIFSLLSTGTGEVISGAIDELVKQSRAGALGSLGLVFLLLTTFSLMDQMHFTLNAIWGEKRSRPLLQRWLLYWAVLTILPLLVILSISVTAYLGSIKGVRVLSSEFIPRGLNLLPFLMQGLAFFLLYVFLPKIKVKFWAAAGGAVVAALIWEFIKKGYLFYTSNAIAYNVIYGSLAALPLFMIWLYISYLILLYGAEFSFVWQNYSVIRRSRKRMNIPRQWFEALGLEILIEATNNFIMDGQQLNPDEFASKRSMPGDLVKGAIDKLISANILKEIKGEFVLSRDPNSLTVEEIIEAMRSSTDGIPPFADKGYLNQMWNFLEQLEKNNRKARREWSLAELHRKFEDIIHRS